MKRTFYCLLSLSICLSLSACSTTTRDSMSTADGMVEQKQKINLFAGVTYENLRQEAAAGEGQYVTSLATLFQIPAENHRAFGRLLQSKHSRLFTASLAEDQAAHLNMVRVLDRELWPHRSRTKSRQSL